MMREWNMRSRSCWAIAALAVSAVALGLTAGQASAVAQKRTPTGRVSLAEWKQWNSEAIKLNASFHTARRVSVFSGSAQCLALKDATLPAAYETGFRTEMHGFATLADKDATGAVIPLKLWGQGLRHRVPSYRPVSSLISSGAGDMYSALLHLQLVFGQLGSVVCDQTSNLNKVDGEWKAGYPLVTKGLAALRKMVH
jgi:hypothetical protein